MRESLFPELQEGRQAGTAAANRSRAEKFNDYEGFVEKFKPKKTTDDCYTPSGIYEAVLKWIGGNIMSLEGVEIVRPFWPGGDYEKYDYPEGCVVIDNPPFSILAAIRRFYHSRGIRYFLFAPGLTMGSSAKELDETKIVCGVSITYANGAQVGTSFLTNLDCGGTAIWVAGDLAEAIAEADEEQRKRSKPLPLYEYPANVTSAALLQKISQRGISLRIHKSDCRPISRLESQREAGKSIFGGGWLLSEKAAAEKAAAEKAAAEKAAAEKAAAEKAAAVERRFWPLSRQEREIIASLGAECLKGTFGVHGVGEGE